MSVVTHTAILLWIIALFVLEVNHLKWIWWEFWTCFRDESGGPLRAARSYATVQGCRRLRFSCGFSPSWRSRCST